MSPTGINGFPLTDLYLIYLRTTFSLQTNLVTSCHESNDTSLENLEIMSSSI